MARNLKKKKKTLFKFTYKELEKKEVIIESEISPALYVPDPIESSRTDISLFRLSKVTFFVRMTEEGSQFDIEAKVSGGTRVRTFPYLVIPLTNLRPDQSRWVASN